MKINVDYLQEVLPYVVNNIFEDRVLDNLLRFPQPACGYILHLL